MQISTFTIKNWRSISSDAPISLQTGDITIIAGGNDSGKTALITALFAGLKVIKAQTDYWLAQSIFLEGSKHVSRGTRESGSPQIDIEVRFGHDEINKIVDRMNFQESLSHITHVATGSINEPIKNFLYDTNILKFQLELKENDRTFGVINYVEFGPDFDKDLNESMLMSALVKVLSINRHSASQLLEYIKQQLIYHIMKLSVVYTPNLREFNPYRFAGTELQEEDIVSPKLGPDASELIKFMQALISETGRNNGKYDQFMRYIRILFPEIEDIEVNRPQGGKLSRDIFIKWKKNNNTRYQPLTRSGSGIANAMYLVGRLLYNKEDTLITIIDEPEIGLHPKLQVKFIHLLRKLSEDFSVQWILATHSPYIMRRISNNDTLYLLEHDGAKTNGKQIMIEQKETVFEALGAFLPETLTAKGVVFVEGQTEVEVLKILLNKAGLDVEGSSFMIIPLGGENLFHIEPRDLKRLHEKVMVIIDSDLKQGLSHGGNLSQSKQRYEQRCKDADVTIIMMREYRCIENMYPVEIVNEVLGKSDLNQSYFDEIPGISDKIKVGIDVATRMTEDQAQKFPYVKEIINWWDMPKP